MTNLFGISLLALPATGAAMLLSGNAVAATATAIETETIAPETAATLPASNVFTAAEPVQLAQVTSVSELSDVQPGDWAFTALQRLVEEYGCLEGYPDRTYRGNRALTRYEFAAGLNACLDVVIQLIGPDTDLDSIRRLQEEFAAELATIRGRVDGLETDVAELRAQQFSTTTKLRGQVDAHLVVPFSDASAASIGNRNVNPSTNANQPLPGAVPLPAVAEADATFEYRVRLNFDTSFTGKDRLRIRLQASDNARSLANSQTGLANQSSRRNGLEDNIALDDVYYSFPVGNRISAIIAANSIWTDNFVTSTIVPFDGPSVADAGGPEFYNIYPGGRGLGAGVNVSFSDNLILDLGYASDNSNVNTATGGIFSNNSYIAQLNLLTDGILKAAVTYINSDQAGVGTADYTVAGLLNLDFGNFQVGGHYAYTPAVGGGNLDSYMGGIAISNFLGAGNEFGIYGGISPNVARDPLLVEAYYQMKLSPFLTLTPAVIYTDSDRNSTDDNTALYGALRATFKF